ncbi:4a-hydroxytetrahydrobiopterin dehydratase [Psychrobacter sp. I-STPA10]|uniref:4a-hydroxytetrahydrobiopterin dehydratase n=1 Tax=Psychrobacter sp. I-STPA10 TaxID=2585769 RepID=UPI001E56EBBA|nr:4a-hydroxytetrahydrobiopterin dehydratase [Psychrobacter sp. I-STPA10]
MSHLTDDQVALQLQELNGWEQEGNSIVKTFVFHDFIEAISFMTEVAFHAEKLEHHPEWSNLYNKVHVRLSTLDVNGITSHDIRLAKYMEQVIAPKRF